MSKDDLKQGSYQWGFNWVHSCSQRRDQKT